MATTQYIGARYVPLFAEPLDWNSSTAYEALTIVYYAGNSYTSRQAVPKGIDITNTKYWALTGNYNAQIEAYRKEVQAHDGKITQNAKDIATEVTNRIAADSTLTNNLNAEITRAKAAESTLTTNLNAEVTRAKAAESTNASNLTNYINKNKAIKIYCPYDSSLAINHTANIVITDKVGVIDCGQGMVSATVNQLKALGVTKLDYVVFTHMHGDHVEHTINTIAALKTYISSTTPIYVQMPPASTFAEYSDYTEGLAAAKSLGGSVKVPTDKTSINFGDTKITFYNTNTSNVTSYSTYNELNIFSLVSKIEYENSTYVNCGDIYWTAQNKYTNIGSADFVQWPHHGLNYWDSYNFINQFAMKACYASPSPDGLKLNDGDTQPGRYFRRFIRQNPSIKPFMISSSNTFFFIENGVVKNTSAINFEISAPTGVYDSFDCDANTSDDIEAYTSWDIYTFQTKFKNLPDGITVAINHEITAQFNFQLYAILRSYSRLTATSDFNASFTKYVVSGSRIFRYNLGYKCFNDFGLIADNMANVTLPTFTSFSDVETKYPSNPTTAYKTFIGEWYDLKQNKTYMPRIIATNGIYTSDIFGTYILGPQTAAEFSKLGGFTSGAYNYAPKTVRFKFNKSLGVLAAGYQNFYFTPSNENWTTSKIIGGKLYVIMINASNFTLFENGTKAYETSADTASPKQVEFFSMI